ncbi:hypothetical protein PRNP1_002129 [Phytophthora ramorum]
MAFWGCKVTETKAAIVEVPEGFVLNVCNATSSASNPTDAQLALGLETQQLDGKAWKGAVAHLGGASQPLQVKLDLVFGHKVKFYVANGSGAVNLTGYFQPGPVFEEEAPKEETKKSKKRSREDKKPVKSWDEVSSSDSEEVQEKKVKPTAAPAKKEEQKKPKLAETSAKKIEQKKPKQTEAALSNGASPTGTSQKKKRKKNKHNKQAADGETK